jgi:hypothetical protein
LNLKITRNFILFILPLFILLNTSCYSKEDAELDQENVITIATNFVKQHGYSISDTEVELLRVKDGLEKGPLRVVWLRRSFGLTPDTSLFEREFWVVYFYPKGQLKKPDMLDGDFCVFIDLYTGEIIDYSPRKRFEKDTGKRYLFLEQ